MRFNALFLVKLRFVKEVNRKKRKMHKVQLTSYPDAAL